MTTMMSDDDDDDDAGDANDDDDDEDEDDDDYDDDDSPTIYRFTICTHFPPFLCTHYVTMEKLLCEKRFVLSG
jgi:hypothetical protein